MSTYPTGNRPMFCPEATRHGRLVLLFVTALLYVLLCTGIGPAHAQNYFQGPDSGRVSGGVPVSTEQFMGKGRPGGKVRVMPPHTLGEQDYLPDALNHFFAPPQVQPVLVVDPSARANPFTEVNQLAPGLYKSFNGLDMTNSIPPDPHMAVGPNHILVAVNTQFAIFDKSGNKLFQVSADSWFDNLAPNLNPFDPQIIYDRFSGRWVQVWVGGNLTTEAFYLISVSDDDNPFGNWCNYALPGNMNGSTPTANWNDFPKLGYDSLAIYITANMFRFAGGYDYPKLRIIAKDSLYNANCGPLGWVDFWNLRDPVNLQTSPTAIPVPNITYTSTDTSYMVGDSPFQTGTFVTLWKIIDPVGNPTLEAINLPVSARQAPPNANQLGGGTPLLETGGRRFRTAPVYRDGELWAVHSVAGGFNNAFSFIRYLRIQPASNKVLEEVVYGADGFWYFYPTLMLDRQKNVYVGFSRSSLNEYPGAWFTGRLASDPPGLAPSQLLQSGKGNYVVTFGGSRNRWGDYQGIDLDPVNEQVWLFQEYAAAPSNRWGTWIGDLTYKHIAFGQVLASDTGQPLSGVKIELLESGMKQVTDSTGTFQFGSPHDTVHVSFSVFAYRDTTIEVVLSPNPPDSLQIVLLPELRSTLSGQLSDSLTGLGVQAVLQFFAHGDPTGGPFVVDTTDSNGQFSVNTIIGTYDITIDPMSPYPYSQIQDVVLTTQPLNLDIKLNPADVLLVDDDRGQDYETFYIGALAALGKTYHHWDVSVDGVPTAADRNAYPNRLLIWFTGDSSSQPLTAEEQASLLDHLNAGGRMFLTGQDIAETADSSALLNALGVGFKTNTTITLVRGISGDPISSGLNFVITSAGGANNQTSTDALVIRDSTRSATIFHYGGGTTFPAGVRMADDSTQARAVFLGFGYEAINDAGKRKTLMDRVLTYLLQQIPVSINEPRPAISQKLELLQNYPNPFNPSTQIRFSLPVNQRVVLTIYNVNGQKVRTLVDGVQPAGLHQVRWDGTNQQGQPVASGIYLYELRTAAGERQVKKLILIR